MEYYQKKVSIAQELGDKPGYSNALKNMTIIYKEQGNFKKALKYYQLDLSIWKELLDKQGSIDALGNIGNVYMDQGDYRKAIEYHEKAIFLCKELGDNNFLSQNLLDIAENLYCNAGI